MTYARLEQGPVSNSISESNVVAVPAQARVGTETNPLPPWRKLAVFAVLTAMSLVVMDAGMVNVALPTIADALTASPATTILIVTAYQVGLVVALLPLAAIGERVGNRRVFVAGIVTFTLASVLCAWSPSLAWLIAARFLQGLGGAAVMALGIALLQFIVPKEQLGAAIGWNALTVALSSAAGPALGAIILDQMSWHWLFLVNLPVGVMVLAAASALPQVARTLNRIDAMSVLLNGVAFAGLVMGGELLPREPMMAAPLFVVAGLAFSTLLRREVPKTNPMFPLDLLRVRPFRLSVIASILCFSGQTGGLLALPFYLQHELGISPLLTGLYLTAWPLSVAATAMIAGRLSDRISTAWLCAVGASLLAAGLAATAFYPFHSGSWEIAAFAIICGIGFRTFPSSQQPEHVFFSTPVTKRCCGRYARHRPSHRTDRWGNADDPAFHHDRAGRCAAHRTGDWGRFGFRSSPSQHIESASGYFIIEGDSLMRRLFPCVVLATLAFLGERASAEAKPGDSKETKWEFMVSSGILAPTGSQQDFIKLGELTSAQLSYVVRTRPGPQWVFRLGTQQG